MLYGFVITICSFKLGIVLVNSGFIFVLMLLASVGCQCEVIEKKLV